MVDTERWAESQWRLVIAVWAYVLVVAGMLVHRFALAAARPALLGHGQ